MAFDYKKEYRELYLPGQTPSIITVPETRYAAVRGRGDPNEPGGAYQDAIGVLYGLSFTIRMNPGIDGYFPYVVPPLEGLWRLPGQEGIDCAHKAELEWISMIRLPEFVTREVFDWAVAEASSKKKRDFSGAVYFSYREGLCVQCMHLGSYDGEGETVRRLKAFARQNGCVPDLSSVRMHHEIYLSDPRRTAVQNLRTVIRLPVAPDPRSCG